MSIISWVFHDPGARRSRCRQRPHEGPLRTASRCCCCILGPVGGFSELKVPHFPPCRAFSSASSDPRLGEAAWFLSSVGQWDRVLGFPALLSYVQRKGSDVTGVVLPCPTSFEVCCSHGYFSWSSARQRGWRVLPRHVPAKLSHFPATRSGTVPAAPFQIWGYHHLWMKRPCWMARFLSSVGHGDWEHGCRALSDPPGPPGRPQRGLQGWKSPWACLRLRLTD